MTARKTPAKLSRSQVKLLVPTVAFESEEELSAHLLDEDTFSGTPSAVPRYLYRGQSLEYRRQWPLTDGPFRPLSLEDLVDLSCWELDPSDLRPPIPLLRYTMDLPSLIPTATRAYEQHLKGRANPRAEEVFDEGMVYFCTTVCMFLFGLAIRIKGDANAAAWFQEQWDSGFPHRYKLRSIGQHYGMETGMLDTTASIPVALWFATHDFRTGAYRANTTGVVYRINRARLAEVEGWIVALPAHEGRFDAYSVDIGDTPETIAPRAVRQRGWSLAGWDHPRIIIRMVAQGGLVQYVFRTSATPSDLNPLTHQLLVPPDDILRELFEEFWSKEPASFIDAQAWVDRYWNVIADQQIRLDAEGHWMAQFSAAIGRIFHHYETRVLQE